MCTFTLHPSNNFVYKETFTQLKYAMSMANNIMDIDTTMEFINIKCNGKHHTTIYNLNRTNVKQVLYQMEKENKMYKYPEKLIDFLTEQESEGYEIVTTNNQDGTVWFILCPNIKCIVMVEWYDGQDKFSVVNIAGKAFNRLHKIIHEMED